MGMGHMASSFLLDLGDGRRLKVMSVWGESRKRLVQPPTVPQTAPIPNKTKNTNGRGWGAIADLRLGFFIHINMCSMNRESST